MIGASAAILSTICWLPQTIRTWRTRHTKDLSLAANLMILGSMSLWLTYGIMLSSWPMIVANTVAVMLVGSIIIAKLKFG
ncbi:SemiSWEET transporter [uncultured Aliiroseovarius sp.]|uniref:SemiSWEET family sugar transporter n=1 Tax=uncultured Aliiroseovarius sp. TaxID=1658783 RepID=UPI00261C7E12|nr:SemiSWEET transporter [uncultured Aliiroseovarius sp.]